MKKESLWVKDIKIGNIKRINKDIDVDILIVGGGIAGISTSYYLKDSNLRVCLVEQGYVGMGVTSKTTGKINYLQETIYSDLENKYSYDVAKKYFDSQQLAINEILRIMANENIECNLEKIKSFIFTEKDNEIENIKLEKEILEKFGVRVNESQELGKYSISVDNTYVFHPLKFIYFLKKIVEKSGIDIYEQSRVKEMKRTTYGYECLVDKYKIRAKKVLLTCHYPFFLKPFMMPFKVYTEKSYVTASKVENVKEESGITSSYPVHSFRYHKDRDNYLIYLNNSHNICNNINDCQHFKEIVSTLNKKGIEPSYVWSNDDIMTVDKIPYIGQIEKDNSSLLMGTGFSTWGMTNGVLTGFLLSNMILNKKTGYEELFNPLRASLLVNLGGCLVNIGSSLKSIVQNKIVKNKNWYSDKVRFEVRNGKDVAIYNDSEKEHIVFSNCPHMGCTLLFNEFEKTWDCPCHASRFDLDGKCIKGPSSYDISYKEESKK